MNDRSSRNNRVSTPKLFTAKQARKFAAKELEKMRKLRGDCGPAANCTECDMIRKRIAELRAE